MTRGRFWILVVAAMGALSAACGSGAECATDSDCAGAEVCFASRCFATMSDAAVMDGSALDAGELPTDGGTDAGPVRPPRDASPPDAGPRMGLRDSDELLEPGTCSSAVSTRPFEDPVMALHWEAVGVPYEGAAEILSAPIVIDFVEETSGDMIPEIIFATRGTGLTGYVLRVLSGRAPHEHLMTLPGDGSGPADMSSTGSPSFSLGHLAGGDLDGDGRPEVVGIIATPPALPDQVVAIRSDGTHLWRVDLPAGEFLSFGSLAIHDLEGDGQAEVVLGNVVLEGATGALRFVGTSGSGINPHGPLSCVADIVQTSPGQEIIAGQAVYAADGRLLRESRIPAFRMEGFCAVADVVAADGSAGRDGQPEVIRSAALRVIIEDGETGEELGEYPLGCEGPFVDRAGGAPTVADFDGDGQMEIGVAGYDCYVVIDPGCVGDPLPADCERRGVLWEAVANDQSAMTSSAAFDFDGDGSAEVVYADQSMLRVYDGRDGTVLFSEHNPSGTITEQPVIADVDNDGEAEIVVAAELPIGFPGFPFTSPVPPEEYYPGLEIWQSDSGRWQGTLPVWNQHTYHVDHIGADGTVTSPETNNWQTHNTYRSNAVVPRQFEGADLTADTLSTDGARCLSRVLEVCAQVFNRGEIPPGEAIEVTFYAGDPTMRETAQEIGTATLDRLLARGEFDTVCVEWQDAPTVSTPVFVDIDSSGVVFECFEDNNTVELGEASCDGLI